MSFLVLLYVFHYGNNLQRFGFIKGHLPNEKEANQGLTYEDIKDTLDESVRSIYENFSTQTQEDFGKKMREEIEREITGRREKLEQNQKWMIGFCSLLGVLCVLVLL